MRARALGFAEKGAGMGTARHFRVAALLLGFAILACLASFCNAQGTNATTSAAESPTMNECSGVYISYSGGNPTKIYPYAAADKPGEQPYSFKSTLQIINMDTVPLDAWQVFVGFQHREIIVSADGAVLADGSAFPAEVGNGTVFSGYPNTDLKTAIDTAGDMTQISAKIAIVGTEFGVGKSIPMPRNISLANSGYDCPTPHTSVGFMEVCCQRNPDYKAVVNVTQFLPRLKGDLTMYYDVTQASDNNYWAKVTISNDNILGRLDYWQLSWQWERGEFIYDMKGAVALEQDLADCMDGTAGSYYQGLQLWNAISCSKNPTIVDLNQYQANDTQIGKIEYCCRNGTLLPAVMDPSKSKSAFTLQVYKLPPDLNLSVIHPPVNWKIQGILNPDYQCSQPRRVDSSEFPDPNGTPRMLSAIASWQVVCNITQTAKPRCCVSFSAYYNESAIPCKTCACGCPANTKSTCSQTATAMLVPTSALLVPYANRTSKAVAWARLKHFAVPNPLPCGDNCGVSVNWHVLSDYRNGWSARITLFNWEDYTFADWFVAVDMAKALPGYQQLYSFNGTLIGDNNNTLFMQGNQGLNYLVAEQDTVPGKQQSVVSFTKKTTPGINIVVGDGFPTKLFFNGEECSLPESFPASNAHAISSHLLMLFVPFVFFILF